MKGAAADPVRWAGLEAHTVRDYFAQMAQLWLAGSRMCALCCRRRRCWSRRAERRLAVRALLVKLKPALAQFVDAYHVLPHRRRRRLLLMLLLICTGCSGATQQIKPGASRSST